MSEPIPLAAGVGSYLCAIHLYRRADGSINAVLMDAPNHVIERNATITQRFTQMSVWCVEGAVDLLIQGLRFDEEHRASMEDQTDGR